MLNRREEGVIWAESRRDKEGSSVNGRNEGVMMIGGKAERGREQEVLPDSF